MASFDKQFQDIVRLILERGTKKGDRTGTGTISYPGIMIRHDMADGFPLLTLRKAPFKSAAVELEGFIKGITSKKWYQERGCKFWNEWCAPYKVKYDHDEETKKKMAAEDDLGPIYGFQGRQFGSWRLAPKMHDQEEQKIGLAGPKVDQLKNLVETLKTNPDSRRMLVCYWNPLCNDLMALVPCHITYQVNVLDGRLNLFYSMRSVDWPIGNAITMYGLLLHLLAKEAGLKEGMLVGFFADAHIYLNQIEGAKELLNRNSDIPLPQIKTPNFTSIFGWQHSDTILENYNPLPAIKFEVAV